jgi:hypothetical protein
MQLESLEDRMALSNATLAPVDLGSIGLSAPPTSGAVQLLNFAPTATLAQGVAFSFSLTISYGTNGTWTQTYNIVGGLTAGQIRDLVLASVQAAGFTASATGTDSLIISGYTSNGVVLGINSVTAVALTQGMNNPNQFLPVISGTVPPVPIPE